MVITRLKVSNFKSFDEIDVELRPLNVVIGANASGKSNFVSVFSFLRDISTFGLPDAVSKAGGVKYLRNLQRPDDVMSVEFEFEGLPLELFDEPTGSVPSQVRPASGKYGFSLAVPGKEGDVEVLSEILDFRVDAKGEPTSSFNIKRNGRRWESSWEENGIHQPGSSIPAPKSSALLAKGNPSLNAVLRFPIFDFNIQGAKTNTSDSGRASLEPNAGNLAVVLERILSNKDTNERFHWYIDEFLPNIENVSVQRPAEGNLMLCINEQFTPGEALPVRFASDGTVDLMALIAALFFQEDPVAVFEEPTAHVHPHLISDIVHLFKEASRHKQIIITTHNPELVRYADPQDLLLVSRDGAGYSRLSHPGNSNELKVFLENEIGVSELFIDRMLEMVR